MILRKRHGHARDRVTMMGQIMSRLRKNGAQKQITRVMDRNQQKELVSHYCYKEGGMTG